MRLSRLARRIHMVAVVSCRLRARRSTRTTRLLMSRVRRYPGIAVLQIKLRKASRHLGMSSSARAHLQLDSNCSHSISHPTPVTTTSPPPPELGSVKYPSLMSQHQLKQGYVPSLQSMFAPTSLSQAPDSSLLFEPKPRSGNLYSNILPSQSTPIAPVIPPYPTHMPVPESHQPPATYTHSHTQSYSSQKGPSPRPPPPPQHRPSGSTSSSRIVPGSSKDVQLLDLRTVKLPRDCLPKFLSIARVNTLQNRETCGLLLGKDKGTKYVVTTLLIPKQHSTSDTCMMDEEELVLQFTEERHLITLGWVSRTFSIGTFERALTPFRYIPTLRNHVSLILCAM